MNNEEINSKIKISNNSSFVILIFVILKSRNIGCSPFRRSKFWPPPVLLYFQIVINGETFFVQCHVNIVTVRVANWYLIQPLEHFTPCWNILLHSSGIGHFRCRKRCANEDFACMCKEKVVNNPSINPEANLRDKRTMRHLSTRPQSFKRR